MQPRIWNIVKVRELMILLRRLENYENRTHKLLPTNFRLERHLVNHSTPTIGVPRPTQQRNFRVRRMRSVTNTEQSLNVVTTRPPVTLIHLTISLLKK